MSIQLLKLVGVIGIEPIQSETPDLQSGPALPLRRTPVPDTYFALNVNPVPSQQRDSNPRPADYKSAALAN